MNSILIPLIDEKMIAALVSDEVFAHGHDYEAYGAVQRVIRRANTIEAVVQGTQVEPYRVRITFYPDGHFGSRCTCPYAAVPCKHVVAALLYYARQPDAIAAKPALAEQLAGLDQGQLMELVLQLLDERPELADAIDAHLSTAQFPVLDAPGDLSGGGMAVDSMAPQGGARLEALVHALMPEFVPLAADYADGNTSSVADGQPEASAFDEFAGVVEIAHALAEAGSFVRAVEVLGSVTGELVVRWPPAEMVSAEDCAFTRQFFAQVADAWVQLLAEGTLPADAGQAWAEELAVWQHILQPYGVANLFDTAAALAFQAPDATADPTLLPHAA